MFTLSESIDGVVVRFLRKHEDERGWLSELYRSDEWDHEVTMCYLSWTQPGKARGPHEHIHQSDFFAFLGPGMFRLYLWDTREESETHLDRVRLDVGADNPAVVLVPPGVVHAYKCISDEKGLVVNLPDRLYAGEQRKQEVDEIRHEDKADSPFVLD
jgi:dTDP-4-dehydrorhamnose 3,5-epimerase